MPDHKAMQQQPKPRPSGCITNPTGLVDQCVTVQLDASPSATSTSSASSTRMLPSAQRVILRRETRDFIATNSYRIAKTIASKADYEVGVCMCVCVPADAGMED